MLLIMLVLLLLLMVMIVVVVVMMLLMVVLKSVSYMHGDVVSLDCFTFFPAFFDFGFLLFVHFFFPIFFLFLSQSRAR